MWNRPVIFITGTGTGVGKTLTAAAISFSLLSQQKKPRYFKPIETGVASSTNSDAGFLSTITGQSIDEISPYRLRFALAPLVASLMEQSTISLDYLDDQYQKLRQKSDVLLVEGAGGLSVPICCDRNSGTAFNYAHLAQRWQMPLLIIADAALGTLNHTCLTVQYARQLNLNILGLVINNFPMQTRKREKVSEVINHNREVNSSGDEPLSPSFIELLSKPLNDQQLSTLLAGINQDSPHLVELSNPPTLSYLTGLPIWGIIPKLPELPFQQKALMAANFIHLK